MNEAQLRAIKAEFAAGGTLIESYIRETAGLRAEKVPPKLFESMEYSLEAGGKRLRPILCLAAAQRCGVEAKSALPMARENMRIAHRRFCAGMPFSCARGNSRDCASSASPARTARVSPKRA